MVNPVRLENEYFVSTTTAVNEDKVFRGNDISEFSTYTETYNAVSYTHLDVYKRQAMRHDN